MIVEPKIRGFLCTTAHSEGCKKNVIEQIDYTKSVIDNSGSENKPKNVLIIGSSTGYGLSSRVVSAFGYGASTLGVVFERPAAGKRTASAGWYNTAAFESLANENGLYAKTINGDAFSDNIKNKVIEIANKDGIGKFDLVIYSLAAPRRVESRSGNTYSSVLKPVGETYSDKTVDVMTGVVSDVSIEPANEKEVEDTVKVMGGEDWLWWLEALSEADLLSDNVTSVAYSYIGPELTYPIYRSGTIGLAKEDLEAKANDVNNLLSSKHNGRAFVSVNKAVVTQASAAIPVVPLYMSLLYKVMKEKNLHEGCIEQIARLFKDFLYSSNELETDDKGRIRIDDWEMLPEVQAEIEKLWPLISTETLAEVTDIDGYREEFYKLFGFNVSGVDYQAETDVEVNLSLA